MFNFGGGASYGLSGFSNGNSFVGDDMVINTEPQLIHPDPFRRMP